MIKRGKRINRKRLYSEDFKKRMVHLFESGHRTILELSKEYDFSKQALYQWVYKYSKYNKKGVQIVEMKDSQGIKIKQLEQQVKELEQGVHQSKKRQMAFDNELCVLVKTVDVLKREHPGCGVEKMYYTLKPKTMGRDKFCEIFLSLGYGVKKVKNYRRTTALGHISYPNLIAGLEIDSPGRVVQTDITYFELNQAPCYIVFILDVYTREIVGYQVGDHLRTQGNLKALEMGLAKIEISAQGLIHHSDRGSQYGSNSYRNKLKKEGIRISMGLTALENAYAERVNGIIKNEYLSLWDIKDLKDLKRKTKQAVEHYNTKRKHRGHQMKYSPQEFKQMWLHLNPQDRPKVTIYTEGKTNLIGASRPNEISPRTQHQAPFCPMDFNLVLT